MEGYTQQENTKRYTLKITVRFEWNESKNLANQAKHNGISFEIAAKVFHDPNFILQEDRIDETGEQRYHAIGSVDRAVLLVVHVYRETTNGEEIIRIISAREANQRECRLYFQ